MRPGTRIVLAGAAALALLPACYGSSTTVGHADGGTDADPEPGTCIGTCTSPYVAGVTTCHEEHRSCLLSCDGFEDHACEDPCEMQWDACTYERDYEAERCMEGCPCWEPFMACTDGCGGMPGDACWTTCESGYGVCSGEDITGLGACMAGCASPIVDCEESCEESHGIDWETWVGCTTDCEQGFTSCMDDCF